MANGIPALLVSGWHDVYQRGAVLDYAGSRTRGRGCTADRARPAVDVPPMTASQRPTRRYQLVVGPWFHNPMTLGPTFQELQLAWFDRWLKGIHDGIDQTSTPLHVFELGANRWIDQASWPLAQARAHTYYLGAGTLGASRPGTGRATAWPGRTRAARATRGPTSGARGCRRW